MAAYRRVNDSCHLQADCQKPGTAPEPYARYFGMGYLFNYPLITLCNRFRQLVLQFPVTFLCVVP